jgi:integrase
MPDPFRPAQTPDPGHQMKSDLYGRFRLRHMGPLAALGVPEFRAEALRASWQTSIARFKPRTRAGYDAVVERFLVFWGRQDLRPVQKQDVIRFIGTEAAICGHLGQINFPRNPGYYCGKGIYRFSPTLPAACEESCPAYSPRHPLAIDHVFKALDSFFGHLSSRDCISQNFIPDLAKEYARTTRHERDLVARRVPLLSEVIWLIRGTVHPVRRAVYMLLFKTGFRNHEVLLVSRHVGSIDLDNGYVRIPVPTDHDAPSKRRGKSNRTGIIDAELDTSLRAALDYVHDFFPTATGYGYALVGNGGKPLGERIINQWLREDTVRLGLVKDPKNKSDRITAHCARHFFTTQLTKNKCPPDYASILRGDLIAASRGDYISLPEEDLRREYLARFPTFGI